MAEQPLFWDVVEKRRSIRKYKQDPVPGEMIEKILAAGVVAPNARNRQSWRFVVLTAPKQIESLADALNDNFRQDKLAEGKTAAEVEEQIKVRKARICGAPAMILLAVDCEELEGSPEYPSSHEYIMAVQSAALAGGQMLLAAEALGLGGLWMGGALYAQKQVVKTLSLPDTWLPQGLLLIGYPDEAPGKQVRKAMDQVVKYFS